MDIAGIAYAKKDLSVGGMEINSMTNKCKGQRQILYPLTFMEEWFKGIGEDMSAWLE